MIGKTISHYKILEKLGEGGMGVVYKAEDTKLKREVAIKFLPGHIAAHDEERERFKIEAQAAAALNHPNIATIYNIEEADDELFIVMEYIEGRELKEIVETHDHASLRIDDVINYASQIAEGLRAAHKKGVVHRDIKSSNIMITDDDQVKIMDFGLAKVSGGAQFTRVGTTLGTAAYMSPEQARGEEVDHRSDIWSFGVVLYEMLAGQLPFRGDFEQAVIYSILNEDPEPLIRLRPDAPEGITEIIHQALSKEPDDRFATANELLGALKATRKTDSRSTSLVSLVRRPSFIVTGILLLIALTAIAVWWQNRSAKIKWAREQAIPEVEKLALERNYDEAFKLAKRVEEVIPDDARLTKLLPIFSRFLYLDSDPSNADVYRKEYSAVDADWEYLGKTPIDSLRFPYGFSRLKIDMEGFQTVEVADVSGKLNQRNYKLDAEGSIPPGMVRLPGSEIGLSLPGLNHVKAEKLSDVFLDKFEVTNKAFQEFVDGGGYQKREYWKHRFLRDGKTLSWEDAMTYFKDKTGRPGPASWEVGDYPTGQGKYPVMGVSWYEAEAYAEFVGKSLPTIFHWNSAAGTRRSYAIVPLSNFGDGPSTVGSHQGMTRWGTYDMAGNVREWCWNDTDRPEQRYILGGGWNDATYSFN